LESFCEESLNEVGDIIEMKKLTMTDDGQRKIGREI